MAAMLDDCIEGRRLQHALAGQNHILEMLATGSPLDAVLDALCRLQETLLEGGACAVLLLDAAGARLRHCAAPSLPPGYTRAVDGVPIGPAAGSCGTAAYRDATVIVEDIAADPLWAAWRDAALAHGLRSCWSMPIRDAATAAVLGTFAVYYRERRAPSATELCLLGRASHLAGITTSNRRAEAALRRSEQRYRDLFENANDIIYTLDLEGNLTSINQAAERLTGYSRAEALTMNISRIVAPEHLDRARAMLAHKLDAGVGTAYDLEIVAKDGRRMAVEVSTRLVLEGGAPMAVQGIARDITERRLAEQQLAHQAFHDALTGLPNRALFTDRLAHALARAGRRRPGAVAGGAAARGRSLAVMFLDLDRFKVINDSLGHGTGDELLVAVARRLAACLRPGDTVSRFGGDEFTVLIEDVGCLSDATQAAERIIAALRAPFTVAEREVFVTASIGITLSGPGHAEPADLLREADVALYQAKAGGRAGFAVFDPRMNERAVERLDLETDLRRALERGELRLYYQPEVDLATAQVVGMEALARWEHPRHGLILPGAFIPLAEETGLILPIGRWVLEEACRQARAWADQRAPGQPPVGMSVNLSVWQFRQPDIVRQVAAILEETGVDPACLRLEITESTVMQDADSTIATLHALKALGVHLAIDDFGTGYSSLTYLRRFPVDTLKVDRSFVSELAHERGSVAIVQAVTALAHALGMDVTVEGVENAEQLASAWAVYCDRAQGHYFSVPLTAEAMGEVLRCGLGPADRRPAGGGGAQQVHGRVAGIVVSPSHQASYFSPST